VSDVKIGVMANADSARAAVNVMTDAVNNLAKSVAQANNTPFEARGFEELRKRAVLGEPDSNAASFKA
jgi:hypothetical protein